MPGQSANKEGTQSHQERLRSGVWPGARTSQDNRVPHDAPFAPEDRAEIGRSCPTSLSSSRPLPRTKESVLPKSADGDGRERETNHETADAKTCHGGCGADGTRRAGHHVKNRAKRAVRKPACLPCLPNVKEP